jgi:hypothetical protein
LVARPPGRAGWLHGHLVVVGDDPGQIGAELLGGREVDCAQGSELGRRHRAGSVQDAIVDPQQVDAART